MRVNLTNALMRGGCVNLLIAPVSYSTGVAKMKLSITMHIAWIIVSIFALMSAVWPQDLEIYESISYGIQNLTPSIIIDENSVT